MSQSTKAGVKKFDIELARSLQDKFKVKYLPFIVHICDLAVTLDVIFVNIIFQVGDQFNLYVEAHDGVYFCVFLNINL